MLATPSLVAQLAAISGVVRDTGGVAQLGVLVQVTAANSSLVEHVFTDMSGRYLFANLPAGHYQVQASQTMFAPLLKPNLTLRAGARAVVNLTLTALFDTTAWLPAERRKADEPSDDWKWTLRSATNRPILRVLEDGRMVMSSSSAVENRAPRATTRGRSALSSGDGGFGKGGIHHVLTMDTAQEDGSGIVLRADTGTGRTQFGVGPSSEMSAGFERQTGFATMTRAVASVQTHPEMTTGDHLAGFETMQLATAQRTKLGDAVSLEAGGTLSAMHAGGYAFAMQPFLRVSVEPAAGRSFGYRMATSRDVQGFSGLNAVQPDLPVAAWVGNRLRAEDGNHQEFSAARSLGRGQVKVALYKDHLRQAAVAGGGSLTAADFKTLPGSIGAVADTMTDNFRLLMPGYDARGVDAMVTQPLGGGLWVAAECSTGTGLGAGPGGSSAEGLPAVLKRLAARRGESASVAVNGRVHGSGTRVRAVYRWQPGGLLTPIDGYREFADQAFLSFAMRQAVRWEGVLPPGLEASVDVTNLLAQGYVPFISADGRTLFLSQAPKTLQAGLSINF